MSIKISKDAKYNQHMHDLLEIVGTAVPDGTILADVVLVGVTLAAVAINFMDEDEDTKLESIEMALLQFKRALDSELKPAFMTEFMQ